VSVACCVCDARRRLTAAQSRLAPGFTLSALHPCLHPRRRWRRLQETWPGRQRRCPATLQGGTLGKAPMQRALRRPPLQLACHSQGHGLAQPLQHREMVGGSAGRPRRRTRCRQPCARLLWVAASPVAPRVGRPMSGGSRGGPLTAPRPLSPTTSPFVEPSDGLDGDSSAAAPSAPAASVVPAASSAPAARAVDAVGEMDGARARVVIEYPVDAHAFLCVCSCSLCGPRCCWCIATAVCGGCQ
jgi:hypothetical protein